MKFVAERFGPGATDSAAPAVERTARAAHELADVGLDRLLPILDGDDV